VQHQFVSLFSQAIKDQRRVVLRYDGQNLVRIVEPHALYLDENNDIQIDAYQTRSGREGTNSERCWMTFALRKIDSLYHINKIFETRTLEGFERTHARYHKALIAMVKHSIIKTAQPEIIKQEIDKPDRVYDQARGLWMGINSVIDQILANDNHRGRGQ